MVVVDEKIPMTAKKQRDREILRGQCFNAAAVIVSKWSDQNPKQVLLLARDLFDEALNQDFLEW